MKRRVIVDIPKGQHCNSAAVCKFIKVIYSYEPAGFECIIYEKELKRQVLDFVLPADGPAEKCIECLKPKKG